ncbi:MAG: hotdog fold thioesterase [Prevotellaceae bacterium]|nr:hotdog fold thioesterase [Prevotellaceae bacterium]
MNLREYFKQDKFSSHNGVELIDIAEGYSKARMYVTEGHGNALGFCQGGAIFTLADLAFAVAANSRGIVTVSANSNISFIRSVKVGQYIYAEAHEIVNHYKLPFIEVRISDEEGTLLAIMTSTGYRKTNVTIE